MKLSWKWVFQARRQFIYLHPKRFGALGYISDSNRNAEGLLTTADNGEHIQNSMKSLSDIHVKMWMSADVSGTDSVPISRVLLVVWLYQTISKCAARTNWWRFFPYKGFGNKYPLGCGALFTRILRNWTFLKSSQYVSVSQLVAVT